VAVLLEALSDWFCNPISAPRIMLDRLGFVLPVSGEAAVWLVDFSAVDVSDDVSSLDSRLDNTWDRPPVPYAPMPAMDIVVSYSLPRAGCGGTDGKSRPRAISRGRDWRAAGSRNGRNYIRDTKPAVFSCSATFCRVDLTAQRPKLPVAAGVGVHHIGRRR
jgi:hypothetical protein